MINTSARMKRHRSQTMRMTRKNAGTQPKSLGTASTLMVSDDTHVSSLIARKLFQQVVIFRGIIGFTREKNRTAVLILAVMHTFPVTTIAYNTTGPTFSQLRARKVTERTKNYPMTSRAMTIEKTWSTRALLILRHREKTIMTER